MKNSRRQADEDRIYKSKVPARQASNRCIGHKIWSQDTALNLVWGLRMWQQKLGNYGHASGALSVLAFWQEEGSESCWQSLGINGDMKKQLVEEKDIQIKFIYSASRKHIFKGKWGLVWEKL